MVRLEYEITSEQPCQIPVLGEFEAGETKKLDETALHLFEQQFGYKVGAGKFAPSVHLAVTVVQEREEDDEAAEVEEAAAEETEDEEA